MHTKEIIQKILEINKFEKLNPMQEKAITNIGENTLITTPTASGKTTVFEIYMLDCIKNKNKKVIYISPLKALTSEHFKETKKKYAKEFNLNIGISIGDFSESVKYLENLDILFMTYEKLDSILRHNLSWIKEIGLITIDEIHELGNSRGASLESIITYLKRNYKEITLLGLSATIGNSKELAEWMNAKLININYRPVPLEIGVLYENNIYFEENKIELEKEKETLSGIIKDTLKKQKQIIIFCNSRKNTMSFCKKYAKTSLEFIDSEKLNKIALNLGQILEQPTKQCIELSNAVKNGLAFHHAGLVHLQREIIEEEFKKKNIKIIFATPTLAAGINLPAYRVIINNIYRFNEGKMTPIKVNEFMQMAGRAGRPKYDKSGQAIAVSLKENDVSKIYETYINGKPEDIESQLSKFIILRMHLLTMILINQLKNFKEIIEYISYTFYYHTFGDTYKIEKNIIEILKEFIEDGFLESIEEEIKITELGKKVCYLYIDPYSAHCILEDINIKKDKQIEELEMLYTIINTSEMKNYLNFKKEKEIILLNIFEHLKEKIYFEYEDIYLLNKIYEAKMLLEWINETNEDTIISEYNTSPGEIRNIISKAEWIIYCVNELIKQNKQNTYLSKEYKTIGIRLKYGVKKELVELVCLKNIGRIRARRLFIAGIKGINDIKRKPEKIIEIIGKIGYSILEELKIDFKKNIEQNENKRKESLKDF
ncbi:MAG: DEAD/DEAH box helicase [Candidatus ainarchaeum sp.]|nr:DEAD/DEAH box helicase [Candidatus ainarchaeum sp.]MDD3975979.1 DEAD/DEAH box helicase [Candidatus ainarchaeum sp.]